MFQEKCLCNPYKTTAKLCINRKNELVFARQLGRLFSCVVNYYRFRPIFLSSSLREFYFTAVAYQ